MSDDLFDQLFNFQVRFYDNHAMVTQMVTQMEVISLG
jgi:hypothetical protein